MDWVQVFSFGIHVDELNENSDEVDSDMTFQDKVGSSQEHSNFSASSSDAFSS